MCEFEEAQRNMEQHTIVRMQSYGPFAPVQNYMARTILHLYTFTDTYYTKVHVFYNCYGIAIVWVS